MWDLIVSVPDHCLSFYFSNCIDYFCHLAGEMAINGRGTGNFVLMLRYSKMHTTQPGGYITVY